MVRSFALVECGIVITYCAVSMCQKQRPSYEMVLSVSKVLGNCSEHILCCLLQVLVPKDEDLMGKMVEVEIVETGKHYMKGRLLSSKRDAVRPDVPPPLLKGQVSGLPEV